MSTLRRRIMGAIKPEEDYSMYAVHKKTNAPMMEAIYAQGWSASPNYMTFEEAAAVTDIGTVFRSYNSITSLDELKYFTGITSIASLAFYYMTNLKTITIPENVRTIGTNGALGRLTRLERITWNTPYVNTPYPYVMYAADYEKTDWEFASDNPFYSVVNGCLYSANKSILYAVPVFKQVTFPQECNTVYKLAFISNSVSTGFISPTINYTVENADRVFQNSAFSLIDLRDANIPKISGTFQGCGANTIILPSNCNDFRGNTFYNASNLTALVLYSTTPPSSVQSITYILNNTPIKNGTGYVYVPDASVDAYKADSKWSAIESQIKPISEYNGGYQL